MELPHHRKDKTASRLSIRGLKSLAKSGEPWLTAPFEQILCAKGLHLTRQPKRLTGRSEDTRKTVDLLHSATISGTLDSCTRRPHAPRLEPKGTLASRGERHWPDNLNFETTWNDYETHLIRQHIFICLDLFWLFWLLTKPIRDGYDRLWYSWDKALHFILYTSSTFIIEGVLSDTFSACRPGKEILEGSEVGKMWSESAGIDSMDTWW